MCKGEPGYGTLIGAVANEMQKMKETQPELIAYKEFCVGGRAP